MNDPFVSQQEIVDAAGAIAFAVHAGENAARANALEEATAAANDRRAAYSQNLADLEGSTRRIVDLRLSERPQPLPANHPSPTLLSPVGGRVGAPHSVRASDYGTQPINNRGTYSVPVSRFGLHDYRNRQSTALNNNLSESGGINNIVVMGQNGAPQMGIGALDQRQREHLAARPLAALPPVLAPYPARAIQPQPARNVNTRPFDDFDKLTRENKLKLLLDKTRPLLQRSDNPEAYQKVMDFFRSLSAEERAQYFDARGDAGAAWFSRWVQGGFEKVDLGLKGAAALLALGKGGAALWGGIGGAGAAGGAATTAAGAAGGVTTLQTIMGFLNSAAERATGVINTYLNLHNAAMSSISIVDSLNVIVSNVKKLQGDKEAKDDVVSGFFDKKLKAIFGAENWEVFKVKFQSWSAVFRSGANLIRSGKELANTTQNVLGRLTGNHGKLMNALLEDGLVARDAYPWQAEEVTVNDKPSLSQRIASAADLAERGAQELQEVTDELVTVQERLENDEKKLLALDKKYRAEERKAEEKRTAGSAAAATEAESIDPDKA
jgi:hypothetical protein